MESLIWITLAIACLAAARALLGGRLTPSETIIVLVGSVCLAALVRLVVASGMTTDVETWGGWVVQAEYHEDYTEIVIETSTDSNGNTTTTTRSIYHPPEWHLETSNGALKSIDSDTYAMFSEAWGSERRFLSYDPVVWESQYSQGKKWFPIVERRLYTNKIANSNSMYRFETIDDPASAGVYDYPSPKHYGLRYDPIMAPKHLKNGAASRRLFELNASLGATKQVHMLVCVYDGLSRSVAHLQKEHWRGGNKNEFVVCIGVAKGTDDVDWCEIITWSEVEQLKVDVKFRVEQIGKLDLLKVVDEIVGPLVSESFVKRDFREFDFVEIHIPLWCDLLCITLTIACSLMGSFFMGKSDVDITWPAIKDAVMGLFN